MFASKISSTLVLACFLTLGFAANAQEPAPPPNPGVDQAPAQMDDAKVEKFASAYGSVQSIQEDYTQQLQEVEDREKAQALQQEAQGEMLGAVEEEGLSVQEYNEMIAMMDQDPQLRQRVFSIVSSQ